MTKNNFTKTEDFWAICLGFSLLLLGVLLFFSQPPEDLENKYQTYQNILKTEATKPVKTVTYWNAYDQQQQLKGTKESVGKRLKWLTDKPATWTNNPLDAFYWQRSELAQNGLKTELEKAQETTENRLILAKKLEKDAENFSFEKRALNSRFENAVGNWRTASQKESKINGKLKKNKHNKIFGLLSLCLFFAIIFGFAVKFQTGKVKDFLLGFTFVFALGILSYFLAAHQNMKELGVGYAAWAIILGLLISNTVGTPKWAKAALLTPFYIKTGLVLLGVEILFGKILAIGLPGIFVAWVVTPIVLVSTYWFGQKILKIPSKTLNMTIAADMSVCGVSAAVATAAACKASKEELTLAIGLSMIFTSVMMIVLPAFINYMGMPEVLGGAWIGGTIDATGAVVAAGAFLGDEALNVAATIKMIQNVLIGLIAFGVAVYFATKVDKAEGTKVGIGEIWRRFPKFILGFIGASILFSLLYEMVGDAKAYALIDHGVIRGFSKNIRGWLFCLAFVSIGLSTNFKELRGHFQGGKPLILYICGQTLNLGLTLLMAYIMFYLVFPLT